MVGEGNGFLMVKFRNTTGVQYGVKSILDCSWVDCLSVSLLGQPWLPACQSLELLSTCLDPARSQLLLSLKLKPLCTNIMAATESRAREQAGMSQASPVSCYSSWVKQALPQIRFLLCPL